MRHDPASGAVVIMLRSLKMHGMAQAVTDLIEQGAPVFEAAVPILTQLLKAEVAEREVRSIAYHMKAARFPAYKDLAGFDFSASEINEATVRQLHRCEFIDGAQNVVLIGGPGTGKTRTARLWTYARDERSWAGEAPPATWYRFSGDRKGQHPKDHLARFRGWMHADGYAGFEDLYRSGTVREVACMAHVRRKFVDIHRAQASPIAEEAIRRIAQLYAVEKEARGLPPDRRAELRQAQAAPVFDDLEVWLAMQLTRISGKSSLAAAIRYALTRMERMRPYLDHGILELDNNTAERGMRAIALGC